MGSETSSEKQLKPIELNAITNFEKRIDEYNYFVHGSIGDYAQWCNEKFQEDFRREMGYIPYVNNSKIINQEKCIVIYMNPMPIPLICRINKEIKLNFKYSKY